MVRTQSTAKAQELATPQPSCTAQSIVLPALAEGEHYAGVLIDEGRPTHHLILLPGELKPSVWDKAKAWAKDQGGELPTRREQSLLFANLKDEFQGDWYWSGEQYASDAGYAWCQSFSYGGQHGLHASNKLRARAVRRLVIQSFSPSV